MAATPARARVDGVRKIAVLRPNAVGDFVFALPALHALAHTYPAAEIVLLGKAWHASFLRERPGPVRRVVVMPPVPGVGAPPRPALDDAEGLPLRQSGSQIALSLQTHCSVCGQDKVASRCAHDESFAAGVGVDQVEGLVHSLL